MRIGVVESGRLAGLHQRTAGRQLPDQDRSSVHPSRCGAGTQQALQIHQLLARQFGKSDDVAHTNRVALRTFGLKSNIAILMNKTTRSHLVYSSSTFSSVERDRLEREPDCELNLSHGICTQ